jgi:hypothetical protein
MNQYLEDYSQQTIYTRTTLDWFTLVQKNHEDVGKAQHNLF